MVAFEGTVTRFGWRNPHVYVTVESTNESGETVEWAVETGGTPVMARSGWTPESLQPGDVIRVRGHPERSSGRSYALLVSLEKEDGTVLSQSPRDSRSDQRAADLNGVWRSRGGLDEALAALDLTEKGLAAKAQYDVEADNPRTMCIGDPAPRNLNNRLYLSQIEINNDTIAIRNEYFDSDRVIYMDGRGHPENGGRTLNGHSIGRWEDGDLVIDTTLFADHRSAYGNGVPSGTHKHVVERYGLSEDGTRTVIDVFIEDTEYLTEPVETTLVWDYTPDFALYRYDCDREVARKSTPP